MTKRFSVGPTIILPTPFPFPTNHNPPFPDTTVHLLPHTHLPRRMWFLPQNHVTNSYAETQLKHHHTRKKERKKKGEFPLFHYQKPRKERKKPISSLSFSLPLSLSTTQTNCRPWRSSTVKEPYTRPHRTYSRSYRRRYWLWPPFCHHKRRRSWLISSLAAPPPLFPARKAHPRRFPTIRPPSAAAASVATWATGSSGTLHLIESGYTK